VIAYRARGAPLADTQALGTPMAIAAAAIAQAFLAMARGDLEGVADAAVAVRATGKAESVSLLAGYEWRSLKVGALIGLGRLGQAETAAHWAGPKFDDRERSVGGGLAQFAALLRPERVRTLTLISAFLSAVI
jgi:hypothetical protein